MDQEDLDQIVEDPDAMEWELRDLCKNLASEIKTLTTLHEQEVGTLKADLSKWVSLCKSHMNECLEGQAREKVLIEQRNAWKEIAEYQYGNCRVLQGGEADYPVYGALDAWACGRHQILKIGTPTDDTALKAALAAERERCAKECEGLKRGGDSMNPECWQAGVNRAFMSCAYAIRAIGEE
jgi:hypothetical protein